jgi:hypothetical protein
MKSEKSYYVSVQTSLGKYEQFKVPEPVMVYIRQLENAVISERVKDTMKQLYPRLRDGGSVSVFNNPYLPSCETGIKLLMNRK